jgi:hypothetical protein
VADIIVENHGSIVLLAPESDTGAQWLNDNIAHAMRWGGSYAIEPRYVGDILDGAQNDGLTVR